MITKSESRKYFTTHEGERRGKLHPSSRKRSSNTATRSTLLGGFLRRALLGDAIRKGVPEPEVFEQDLLLNGKTHHVFAGPGTGKSWLALWLAREAIERRETVMYLDMENGKRIITERLQHLGVDPAVIDEHLYYVPYPSLDMGHDHTTRYAKALGSHGPGLLIFDSWVGFLGAANLDENNNSDVERWATSYVNPARRMGWTTVLLDHVPHDASRSRGASRKKDLVDVQWRLENQQSFDRDRVGRVQLKREKDREGFLPERVAFSVGGTPEGFVFERADVSSATAASDMPDSARALLETLETEFGDAGARYEELRRAIPWNDGREMGDSTFRGAKDWLLNHTPDPLIRHENSRYYSNRNYRNGTVLSPTTAGQ